MLLCLIYTLLCNFYHPHPLFLRVKRKLAPLTKLEISRISASNRLDYFQSVFGCVKVGYPLSRSLPSFRAVSYIEGNSLPSLLLTEATARVSSLIYASVSCAFFFSQADYTPKPCSDNYLKT